MKPSVTEVRRLLEEEPMRNLVTLKMLTCYPGAMDFELVREEKRWALLSLLEVSASAWDRKTYPACKYAAFINGNDGDKMVQLLACLPNEDHVVKTTDDVVWEWLVKMRNGTKVLAFHSFTSEVKSAAKSPDKKIVPSCAYDETAWKMFRANGYVDEELAQYFRNGAKWFGIEENGELASACFVFENYQQIWEIAGVYTEPDYRQRGLAKRVVEAALGYLAQSGLVPRYQARWDNYPSLSLARACGLVEFLRMEHYIVRKRE
jgi:ribosomal protein S18 acetylase RimI-like enzyme